MTAAFLRQPDMLVITPSNQSPWVGHVDAPDARFTRAQLYQMGQRGLVPETVEAITVYREANSREMWWPTGAPAPVFQFDCPVLERRRDGKIKVMAPSGEGKFVLANGWVREPSRRNRHILAAEPVQEMREGDTARTIEILRRALAWHGDPQRMATTREEWQQEIDAAIAWVKANPEERRPSFSSLGGILPSEDGWRETALEAFHAIDATLSTSDDVIEWIEPIRASKRGQADDDELRRERKTALYGMLDSAREKLRAALSEPQEHGEATS